MTWPIESYRYTTIQNKTALWLDVCVDQRYQLNKIKLEAMKNIKKDEKVKPSLFHIMKTNHRKEEFFALIDDKEQGTETRIPREIRSVATRFYKYLLKKCQGTRTHNIQRMKQILK